MAVGCSPGHPRVGLSVPILIPPGLSLQAAKRIQIVISYDLTAG
ncbi:hypothetical protein ATKI12_6642 [Kitasatospora sp. Ki12]